MSDRAAEVDQFLNNLSHPLKEQIQQIRAAILDSNEGVEESIKWNAPNFRFKGEDRLTFNLRPQDSLQLIFHRGVKVKDSSGFTFEDKTGLLKWASKDRAVVTLHERDIESRRADLIQVAGDWLRSTTTGSQ
jgi:hypothetical protein